MQFDASFESGNLAEARLVTEMPCVPPSFPHPPRHPPLCPGGPSALCAGSSTTFTSGPIRSTRAIACGSTSRCAARRAARRSVHMHMHNKNIRMRMRMHMHMHMHMPVHRLSSTSSGTRRPSRSIGTAWHRWSALVRDRTLRRADSAVLVAPQLATLASRGGSQARGCATHSGRAAEPRSAQREACPLRPCSAAEDAGFASCHGHRPWERMPES